MVPAFLMSYDAAPDRLREARASGLHLLHNARLHSRENPILLFDASPVCKPRQTHTELFPKAAAIFDRRRDGNGTKLGNVLLPRTRRSPPCPERETWSLVLVWRNRTNIVAYHRRGVGLDQERATTAFSTESESRGIGGFPKPLR